MSRCMRRRFLIRCKFQIPSTKSQDIKLVGRGRGLEAPRYVLPNSKITRTLEFGTWNLRISSNSDVIPINFTHFCFIPHRQKYLCYVSPILLRAYYRPSKIACFDNLHNSKMPSRFAFVFA